eukprot:4796034-Ditylum_brightwellii.AAC.1
MMPQSNHPFNRSKQTFQDDEFSQKFSELWNQAEAARLSYHTREQSHIEKKKILEDKCDRLEREIRQMDILKRKVADRERDIEEWERAIAE